ncbi:phospholipase/carboxylesterase [Brevibacterium sanguinis]|uniref:Phospholipase/carboxylesterase n=2 Tax=Brevibacterium TaxID=1696 RepID=A0A366ILR6_9MICO|nr:MULTISPECIES: phospholipase [Brevibacterium]RBP65733.1 phospholipase/carboxylesterase [Brevibacterium sanguinis]RBP72367.1 phospholipase/carboxylesterase [Brevibacterium celere]
MNPTSQDTGPVRIGPPIHEATLIVYAVHGRGQSSTFMAEVAARTDVSGVIWVMPQAPGCSWYPTGFMAPLDHNQPDLGRSLATLRDDLATLDAEVNTPIVAFGFSQGACLLAEHLLRCRPRLGGVILHTGGYLGPDKRHWGSASSMAGLEVRMLTAAADNWVPLERVEATKRELESAGAQVGLTVYDDPDHHINEESIEEIRRHLVRWGAISPAETALTTEGDHETEL